MTDEEREKSRIQTARWRAANRERNREIDLAYYYRNKEKRSEYARRYRATHQEQLAAYRKTYKAREASRERARKAREVNLERVREISRESARRKRARDAEGVRRRQRSFNLKSKYGITLEQYEALLASQGGVCAICVGPPTKKGFAVDHCHITGKVRGILCGKCNTAIGLLNESAVLIKKASEYISSHEPTRSP